MSLTEERAAVARSARLGDLLRAAAAVSVVVATIGYGWLGFALFFLVLGGTMVPRALAAPAVVDVVYCAVLILGAWAAQLDWYLEVGWLDVVVHAAATGLVAVVATAALLRLGGEGAADGDSGAPVLWAVVTTGVGVLGAVLWELGEWFGHSQVDDRIQVGYADTMTDLLAGLVGAAAAGALVALDPRRARGVS